MLGLQLDNCESISAINSHESHEFQIKSHFGYWKGLIMCKLLYLFPLDAHFVAFELNWPRKVHLRIKSKGFMTRIHSMLCSLVISVMDHT